MKLLIERVKDKQYTNLREWIKKYPDYRKDEDQTDRFTQCILLVGCSGKNEKVVKENKKIYKNLASQNGIQELRDHVLKSLT